MSTNPNQSGTPQGPYAIIPGSQNPTTNPMDLTPANDLLRNIHVTGTVTADGGIIGPGVPSITTGTWVPVDTSGAGLILTNELGSWTQIGNGPGAVVILSFSCSYPANADGSNAAIGGYPTPASGQAVPFYSYAFFTNVSGDMDPNVLLATINSFPDIAVLAAGFPQNRLPNASLSEGTISATIVYIV